MRPDPRYGVAQAVIARDGTGDFTTFADAFAHADDLRSLAMAMGGASTSSARYRVDFFVKPGFYDEHRNVDAPINAEPQPHRNLDRQIAHKAILADDQVHDTP